ncbi:MAG: hypothetical protein A2054_00925 [Deltaproteobacteria bacterium GWA2_55_10]|nr:MAG: hypothetical protein A2054_00925 [Deltaproteobacteria bacterium GWA2_55_10]
MKMRIGYICRRKSFLKCYGPVIYEGLKDVGFEQVLLIQRDEAYKDGAYTAETFLENEAGCLGELEREYMVDENSLLFAIRKYGLRAVVSLTPDLPDDIYRIMPETGKWGVVWCSCPNYVDDVSVILNRLSPFHLKCWDMIGVQNAIFKKYLEPRLVAKGAGEALRRIMPVGEPCLDQIGQFSFERQEIRRRFGLPESARIVLFGSFDRAYTDNPWVSKSDHNAFRERPFSRAMRLMGSAPGVRPYSEHFDLVRSFADRHGALILTKSRFKHGDPEFIANGSDMVVSDRSYYPFTAFEALSIADLVVTAPSLLVLDALALGKPSIVLRPVHNSARHSMSGLYDEFLYDDGGLFNLKGVTETFSTCTEEGWDRFDSWSKEGGFTRPVLGERDAFMKRYGIEPGASARFFHSIAEMICKKETTAHM